MAWLARKLAAEGFRVYRFGYASVRKSLKDNAADLAHFAATIDAPQVHWLGHSLGGIVVFRALASGIVENQGRVVMLGSPLRGSAAGAHLARFDLGRAMVGHSILEWLGAPCSRWALPNELGIIAGTSAVGLGRVFVPGLPKPNDGAVSVAETRIEGAKEHLELPVSHSGMLISSRVVRHAAHFLRRGSFAEWDAR
jgi:pimeloyl-ACP methyl ester carboxylesterase